MIQTFWFNSIESSVRGQKRKGWESLNITSHLIQISKIFTFHLVYNELFTGIGIAGITDPFPVVFNFEGEKPKKIIYNTIEMVSSQSYGLLKT